MSAGEIVFLVATVGIGHWRVRRSGGSRRALRVAAQSTIAVAEQIERRRDARRCAPSIAGLQVRLAVARHRPRRVPRGRHY